MDAMCLPQNLLDRILAARKGSEEVANEANAALVVPADLNEALAYSAQLTFEWGKRNGEWAALIDEAHEEVKRYKAALRIKIRAIPNDKGKAPSVADCEDGADVDQSVANTERFIAQMRYEGACLSEAKWAFAKRHEAILALSQRELWEQSISGQTSVTDRNVGSSRPVSPRAMPRPQVGGGTKKDPAAGLDNIMNRTGGKKK